MKIALGEIYFDCPKCNRPMSGDKALLGEMINCPDCGEAFIPTPRKLDPRTVIPATPKMVAAAATLHSAQLAKLESMRTRDNTNRAEKIHNRADLFAAAALWLCIIGLLVAFCSVYASISGDGAGSGYIWAGSFIGASLWLYLIAQIVHIRANTEK
jgi:divalent metal cation (Fe/Co/Zn/Cd) transporter